MSDPGSSAPSGVRLSELVAALSLSADLGLGQPMEHASRSTLLACRLSDRMGLADCDRAALYYVALLGWVGCLVDSSAVAATFGNDIEFRSGTYDRDMTPLPFLGYLLQRTGSTGSPVRRVATAAALIVTGARTVQEMMHGHCQVTADIAARLGLGTEVCESLKMMFARWDGKGLPAGLGAEDIPLIVRLWHVADLAEVHYARSGVDVAVQVVRDRRGSHLDPTVVDAFADCAGDLFSGLPVGPSWDDLMDAEQGLQRMLTDAQLDLALEVLADYADLKSTHLRGHSRGVAELAAAAGRRLGMGDVELRLLRRAALTHDLGRTGVPNTIWDKPGPLTRAEQERVRLHPYYTQRMLARPSALQMVGAVSALAHERLDGSGHHRGLTAASIPMTGRVLAAADSYHAMVESRPYRAALTPDAARSALLEEVRHGRLDGDAADAVLAVAGHRLVRRPAGPAGLTSREVEVLSLLARGGSNRQIARELGITPKTAGNHIERIYAKAGLTTRAAATLFAMQHGVLRTLEPIA